MKRFEDRSRPASGPLRPAIEAVEARFRDLIEAAADGVIVVGRDGTIAFANPAACALMGRPPHDLAGRPFGIPVVPGETTEVDILRGDGTVRVAEMRTATTAWRGERAHLASLRDVTERKRAEEAAHEALATLRSFYDGASMMMGVVEPLDDDILFASSNASTARFFGRPGEALDGQLVGGLGVPPAILSLWLDRFREAERAGTPIRFEYEHVAPTGRAWLSATVGFIGRSPAGRPRFSFVVEDITDRKRAEEALKEADRRKDEFLAMLAHELRNPLAAINNAVQLARRAGPGRLREPDREVIGRQCAHLARLIDDLMDVSRISRGKIRLRAERLDAATVLRWAVGTVRPLAEQRRHELIASFPDALWVEADPTRLEQIVVNLLTNAAKYTEPGGHIWLTAGHEGGDVVIRVRDDGLGIPPEKLPEMFQLFAQGERHIARSEGGLGIGLTLVRKLAELHGGGVTARSDGPGKGSEFAVHLPAASAPRPSSSPPEAAPDRARAGRSVLVVDDNQDAARLLAELLQASGHAARSIHDGRSALDEARSFRPDVILLDIGLPGMDGYEVAAALRREAGLGAIRIIAVTGYGEEQALSRSREAGIDHHLVKPVDVEALLDLIERPDADSLGRPE